jgi:cyanophycin synthetase
MTHKIHFEGEAQHKLIVNSAKEYGATITNLQDEKGVMSDEIFYNGVSKTITNGIPTEWLNEHAGNYCDNKQLSKTLFQKLKIPSPQSYRFNKIEDLDKRVQFDREFICKPEVGTNGVGVVFDIQNIEDVSHYLKNQDKEQKYYLLEEYVEGNDLRIQIIRGEIVAACVRKPAFILGDGITSVNNLIRIRRDQIKNQNPANSLTVDEESNNLIHDSGYSLHSILPLNEMLSLKRIANMGQGAIAIDVTDELDIRINQWVKELSAFLKTGYFAIDIITKKIGDIGCYKVLELNHRAEWMHHTFSENRTHKMGEVVFKQLFDLN